jgi:hypothetical protein
VMTVNVDGNSWSGTNVGAQGSLDCYDGTIDGNTITWKMDMKVPMPMLLEGTATVDGDVISGGVKAGMFGTMALSGTRVS